MPRGHCPDDRADFIDERHGWHGGGGGGGGCFALEPHDDTLDYLGVAQQRKLLVALGG